MSLYDICTNICCVQSVSEQWGCQSMSARGFVRTEASTVITQSQICSYCNGGIIPVMSNWNGAYVPMYFHEFELEWQLWSCFWISCLLPVSAVVCWVNVCVCLYLMYILQWSSQWKVRPWPIAGRSYLFQNSMGTGEAPDKGQPGPTWYLSLWR